MRLCGLSVPRLLFDKSGNLLCAWTALVCVFHDGINVRIVLESPEYRSAQRRLIRAAYPIWIRIGPDDLNAELIHEDLFVSFRGHPGEIREGC